MPINGLTHNEDGIINSVDKFKGKISTGWQPNEGPNKKNSPAACGFFRFMKQTTIQRVVNGRPTPFQEWAPDKDLQKKLVEANNGNEAPRILEFMCMHDTPEQMFECYMAKYSSKEGLMCKSYGAGTVPTQLTFDAKGERVWGPRTFDGKAECPYNKCPDYICTPQSCKEMGVLKVFPIIDLSELPYRLETRSKNTIMSMEGSLRSIHRLSEVAWMAQVEEAMKNLNMPREKVIEILPFKGLFGLKINLIHRKIKSGGNEVFITDLQLTEESSQSIMSVIRRSIEKNQKAAIAGTTQYTAIPAPIEDDTEMLSLPSSDLSKEDGQSIATEFAADSEKAQSSVLDEAAASLLNAK